MEEFILLDEDKKRMYFTGNEDFQKHKKAFKARMKVLGHEGISMMMMIKYQFGRMMHMQDVPME